MPADSPEGKFAAFEGAQVVVTGGLGFVGANLAARLVGLGAKVLLIDSLIPNYGGNRFNIAAIREQVRVEITDIRDTEHMRALLRGCDYLFNLAGQTSHLDSMHDPVTDLEINCLAQLTLLEACRAVCPKAIVVFASTRQIYGRPDYLPVDEKHLLHPVDVNGVNKMAGEAYHILYHDVYGLPATALRLTNTYGPRMRIKDARQTFVGVWLKCLLDGVPFEVWGGEQKRDFTYVDDAVEAFLLAAVTPETKGKVFNLGGERAVSLDELARLLIAANGGGEFRRHDFPAERRRIDIGDYYAADDLFQRATGWRHRVALEDGLKRSLDYFRAHHQHYG
ncbi:MAG TPA: NAD-dependent epimerase/dehydratase family protein [Stellaceae bacterium]|jgi:UDP-glucose 4-epimerase